MIGSSLQSAKWDRRCQALKSIIQVLKGLDMQGMAPPGSTGAIGKGLLRPRDRPKTWRVTCQVLNHVMKDKVMPVRLASLDLFQQAFSDLSELDKAEVKMAATTLLDPLIDRVGDSNIRLHEASRRCIVFAAQRLLGLTQVLGSLRSKLQASQKGGERTKVHFGVIDTACVLSEHFSARRSEEAPRSSEDSWTAEDMAPLILAGLDDSFGHRASEGEEILSGSKGSGVKILASFVSLAASWLSFPVLKSHPPNRNLFRHAGEPHLAFGSCLCRGGPNAKITDEGVEMLFPMYTVPLQVLFDMGEIVPHEAEKGTELMEQGVLVEFEQTLGQAAFVSHQWVGRNHPDPEFKQMRVLQDALRHVMSDLKYIPLDMNSEALVPGAKSLDTAKLHSKPLFVWYDYFSCPQLDLQATASCRSGIGRHISDLTGFVLDLFAPVVTGNRGGLLHPGERGDGSGLARAIESIPAYIAKSSFFFVLLELVASPVGAGGGGGAPGEGVFTVARDKRKLAPILRQTLKRKLVLSLKSKDLEAYRVLLNLQSVTFRGLDVKPTSDLIPGDPADAAPGSESRSLEVAHFLHQNGFNSVTDSDSRGWSTLHYAALGGDPSLIRCLLEEQADVNLQTKKDQPLVGLASLVSPLAISVFFRHNEAARLLLAAKAKFEGGLQPALNLAGISNNPEGIRILCDIFGFSAMEAAAGQGQVEAVEEILRQAGGSVSSWILNRALYLACCFRGGKAEMIHRLIEMRADVNRPYPFKGFSFNAAFLVAKSLQHRFGKVTSISKMCYHSWGARPLMVAILSAQYEGAAVLIAEGARLDLPNKRGCTAIDLAQGQDLPFFMTEALEGRTGECKHVAKARKKASPTEEALQELDVDKSGKVEQNELESFARSKGMSPEQIHQEFLSLDLNGDGVLEADEIRRTLAASAAADAAPSVADPSAVPASLHQAAAPAESSLVPEPPEASVQVPEQTPVIQAAAPTADVQEDLDVRAQRGAERAVAEMFEKKAAEALAAMREDTSNAEKLEKTARTLRGQARQLEMQ
ncbi:ANKRD52, partial [Symbiodinium microadriaticum]